MLRQAHIPMNIETNPLFAALKPHARILLAGAGGGFDIFSGLPLFFRLRELGHEVWLANYSFSEIEATELEPMVEITSEFYGLHLLPREVPVPMAGPEYRPLQLCLRLR